MYRYINNFSSAKVYWLICMREVALIFFAFSNLSSINEYGKKIVKSRAHMKSKNKKKVYYCYYCFLSSRANTIKIIETY